jgi:hypothetical protein
VRIAERRHPPTTAGGASLAATPLRRLDAALALQRAAGNRAMRDLLQRQDDDDLPPLIEEPGPVPIFDITGRSMREITAWLSDRGP